MSKQHIGNAYEYLRHKLLLGEFRPGMRLHNRELAKEIGVSYTPVREALSRLVSDGLVEHIQGVGAYVRMPDAREIEELLTIREVLELHAVAEAIQHITVDQLKLLESVCTEWLGVMRATRGSQLKSEQLERWIYIDQTFHETLIEAANNRMLMKLIRDQRLLERVFRSMRLETADGMKTVVDFASLSWPRIWRQHAELLRAIRRGKTEVARYWIRAQIADTKHQFAAFFDYKSRQRQQGKVQVSTLEATRRYANHGT